MVLFRKNKYYSYDRTGHGGGVWRQFVKDGKSFKRCATVNDVLKKIRG
ncbi:toxin C-terminal domain-containing protein [Candidatus Dependentiae bacterium]|nr:toxin C-terminal domain-containing protein [Candidatus Dependentiae bacterium]